jgi:HlyD family secretion protein
MKSRFVANAMMAIPLLVVSCGGNNSAPSGSGFIEGTEVVISAETGGRIERLYKDEGDLVNQGDVIVLIDTTTVSLKIAEARAGRESATTRVASARLQIEKADIDSALARKDYGRAVSLLANESTSQQQFDQAETRYKQTRVAAGVARAELQAALAARQQAESDLDILKQQLHYCRPESAVSGTVVTSYVERGELVGIGSPLVKVAVLDTVTVKIYLPPGLLTSVKLGAEARVDPEDGRTAPLAGRVTWISPEAEFTPKNVQTKEARADLVYAVKVTVPNREQVLKIGMPVMVTVP